MILRKQTITTQNVNHCNQVQLYSKTIKNVSTTSICNGFGDASDMRQIFISSIYNSIDGIVGNIAKHEDNAPAANL